MWDKGRISAAIAIVLVSALASCKDAAVAPLAAPTPAQMDIVSGDDQRGKPGEMLASPLVVKVTDANRAPVAGQVVNFRVTSGGGKTFAGTGITNKDGVVMERWTLGNNVNAKQRLEARAVDASTGSAIVFASFSAEFGDPGASVVPVARVVVTPPSAAIAIGDTVQLTAATQDSAGNPLTDRTIAWTSSSPSTATVSSSGLVTGIAAGTANVIATSESKADTSVISVASATPPPPVTSSGVSDPTQLIRATGQRPVAGTYGRTIAAGQTYRDPITNVTVLKVTDASTPASNSGMDKGYSEGGPNISLPWQSGGETYYTLKVGGYLVDVRYGTLALSNWRRVAVDGEIGFAFSLSAATPRIAYVVQGTRVNRYNTATNQVENTGNWPWVPSGGQYISWLQNNLNDQWFVAMFNSNKTVTAFRPSDGFKRNFTETAAGASIDEPHIDRELPFVYLSTNNDARQNLAGNLETGTIRLPNGSPTQSDDHAAPLRGGIVGLSHWERNATYFYDVRADRTVEFASANAVIGYPGDWHMAGQWVKDNGSGLAQWFVLDAWGSDAGGAAVREPCRVRRGRTLLADGFRTGSARAVEARGWPRVRRGSG